MIIRMFLLLFYFFFNASADQPFFIFHTITSFVDAGRTKENFFERTAVVELLHSITKRFEDAHKKDMFATVVVAGSLHQVHYQEQINLSGARIAIIFSGYQATEGIPSCGIYRYNKTNMDPLLRPDSLSFVSEKNAYLMFYDKTKKYAQSMVQSLGKKRECWQSIFQGAFPLHALQGIVIPALIIEIGFCPEMNIQAYGTMIAEMLIDCAQQVGNEV